jgi:hypothetical protein
VDEVSPRIAIELRYRFLMDDYSLRSSTLIHPDALYTLLVIVVKFPAFSFLSLSNDLNILISRAWFYWHAACGQAPDLKAIGGVWGTVGE